MLETQPKGWMEGDEEIMQEGGERDGESRLSRQARVKWRDGGTTRWCQEKVQDEAEEEMTKKQEGWVKNLNDVPVVQWSALGNHLGREERKRRGGGGLEWLNPDFMPSGCFSSW